MKKSRQKVIYNGEEYIWNGYQWEYWDKILQEDVIQKMIDNWNKDIEVL